MTDAADPGGSSDPSYVHLEVAGAPSENGVISGNYKLSPQNILLSIALFIVAGILEIGGGYLYWIALRTHQASKGRIALLCILGTIVLTGYGLVPTFQPIETFGRTFAIYGGFFILLSFLWAYLFEGTKMDAGDGIGCAIAMIGVLTIWFYPRGQAA